MTIEQRRSLPSDTQIIATHHGSGTASPSALIVAGPTASGKSALAMELAERCGGTIINADAMQVYRELRVLTARPSIEEEHRIPHALYGIRPAAEPGSVAWWREAALAEMDRARDARRLPVLTGGTGLYLAALTQGLSAIPDPGPAARDEARRLLKDIGPAALHTRLAEADPEAAARLRPTDSQRIARAWEIWRGTGRSLTSWQALAGQPAPWRFAALLIDPPRTELRAAIAARLTRMLAEGAMEEVRALLALGLDPALPAMRAHGIPELANYLRGDFTLPEAARRIELVTGQYTKRQATWFRHHQLAEPPRVHTIHARFAAGEQLSERNVQDILAFIERMG
ncbi:MAG TPA: tRNA (adenosine(37)-N6)-dimethylallyltransferase MiaA [Acetobacteraceae bacterium]|jgi:tRNA dimethylallyltransferase|nr:tRNA (adenosine(37)-N6)-dimethylallyltransferase MiaA [Acetobacteraceae bacterium]